MEIWGKPFLSKKEKKEERDKAYLDFLRATALPELHNGKQWCLYDIYSVFTMDQAVEQVPECQKQAAQYLADVLDTSDVRRLFELERNFRQMDWSYDEENCSCDWRKTDILREHFPALDDREYAAMLKFGTFHANGYYRQECMERLEGYEDALPYFTLRLNDWVLPVRQSAAVLMEKRMDACALGELFRAIPCMDKVKRSKRRSEADILELEKAIQKHLSDKLSQIDLRQIKTYEDSVRNSIYRMVSTGPVLELEQMNRLLEQERSGCGKKLLIQGILKNYDSDKLDLDRYLTDRSAPVRRGALEYQYQKTKDTWAGMEHMLLDKSSWIRGFTAGALTRHGGFSVYGFYVEQLKEKPVEAAILGIGEFGTEADLDIILPFLGNPRTSLAAAAMTAVGRLAGEKMADLYWKSLFDSRPSVAKRAYRNIRAWKIRYGAECLYEAYLHFSGTVIGKYLIILLIQEDSWKRLPYLLQLYHTEDAALQDIIHKKVSQRNMYAAISREQEAAIRRILEGADNKLPKSLRQEIELDLKYLTRQRG